MSNDPVDPRIRLAIARWPDDAPRGAVTSFCAEHVISRNIFYKLRRRAIEPGHTSVLEPLTINLDPDVMSPKLRRVRPDGQQAPAAGKNPNRRQSKHSVQAVAHPAPMPRVRDICEHPGRGVDAKRQEWGLMTQRRDLP